MAEEKPISDQIFEKLSSYLGASTDSLHKVRFGRGAVGKIAVIVAVALIALGAIGVRIGGPSGLIIAGGVVLVTLAGLGLIFYIAVARPELAVMEGAELVMYKHMTLAAKGHVPTDSENTPQLAPGTEVTSLPIVRETKEL